MSVKDLASANPNTSEVWNEWVFLILYFSFGWHRWISFKFAFNFGPSGITFWCWTYYMQRKIQLTIRKGQKGSIHEWESKSWEITDKVPHVLLVAAVLLNIFINYLDIENKNVLKYHDSKQ